MLTVESASIHNRGRPRLLGFKGPDRYDMGPCNPGLSACAGRGISDPVTFQNLKASREFASQTHPLQSRRDYRRFRGVVLGPENPMSENAPTTATGGRAMHELLVPVSAHTGGHSHPQHEHPVGLAVPDFAQRFPKVGGGESVGRG